MALRKLTRVREKRQIERKAAVINDREINEKFFQIARQNGVYVVETEKAEIKFAEMVQENSTELPVHHARP